MRVQRFTDVAAFRSRVTPYLAAAEALHCLPLGLLTSLAANPTAYGGAPYMACVEDERGEITLVALRTPPHNLILSQLAAHAGEPATINALADDVRSDFDNLPGAIGSELLVRAFAAAWRARTGVSVEPGIREYIYQLRAVRQLQPVSGAMRPIEERDRDVLRTWLDAFMLEALGQETNDADQEIDRRMRGSGAGMYLWEDGAPVSLAGFGGPTPHGIRIGPVYTAPEARGHGYASALVAQMSQWLLDEGRQFCFLFTDVANRTSNHIYQAIGYERVGDAAEIRFRGKPTAP